MKVANQVDFLKATVTLTLALVKSSNQLQAEKNSRQISKRLLICHHLLF